MRIESAVVEGAKNVIRLLQSARSTDKKALQEVKKKVSPSKRNWLRSFSYSVMIVLQFNLILFCLFFLLLFDVWEKRELISPLILNSLLEKQSQLRRFVVESERIGDKKPQLLPCV